MIQIPSWGLALIVSAAAALVGMLTYGNGRRKDRDTQIKEQAATNTKLDVLMATVSAVDKAVNGMDASQKSLIQRLDMHAERLAKVEESAKQAHKRIDEMKEVKGGT